MNGAHSLLAYAGLIRGHETVAAAIGDPVCRGWVNDYWDDAVAQLPAQGLALDEYRTALLDRFDNARIEHKLIQIAHDSVTKLGFRVAPIILAEREQGRDAVAGIRAIGSWLSLVLSGRELVDTESSAIAAALGKPIDRVVEELVRLIDARLADDGAILTGVRAVVAENSDAVARVRTVR